MQQQHDADYRRKRTILYWVSLLVFVQSGSYALHLFASGISFGVACGLLLTSLTMPINLLLFRRDGNLVRAMFIFTLTGIVGNVGSLMTPTLDHTSIYWIPSYPAIAFFLNGVRRGLILNGLYFLSYFGLFFVQELGLISTPYSLTQYLQMSVALTGIFILGYAAEHAQEGFRRELVAQRERLDVIIGRMPVGVVVFDKADGRPSSSNTAAAILLGAPVGPDVALQSFPAKFHLADEAGAALDPEALPMAVTLREGKVAVAEEVFVRSGGSSGERRVLRVASAPIYDTKGKVTAAVSVLEDMTARFEVDRMKSEFLSLATHQLKTPLTSISWAVESVLDDGAKTLPEDQKKTLQLALGTANQMETLVKDLLNVSRIETGRKFDVIPTPTDVVPLLRDVAKSMQGLASQRRIAFSLDGLPRTLILAADPDKFREAMLNLVSNAVKYSRDGGTVDIGANETDADATVHVRDTGIGIPRQYHDKIFTKFYRAPNVIGGIEGTGLGLYIVKVIIEKHGGTIGFESKEGEGAIFHVTLRKPSKEKKDEMKKAAT